MSLTPPAEFPGQIQGLLVEVDETVARPRCRLRVHGELDLATAPVLARALDRSAAAGARELELDLSGVTFCDVVGLTAVEHAQQRLRAGGCRLTLHGMDGPAHLLLKVPGLFDGLLAPGGVDGHSQPA